jgi:hypothetical protein
MAASQCPKCGHYLGLRNDDGDPVPVARCRGCGCYYPRSSGGCRWCGAQPPASRPPTLRWGLGGLAAAGIIWTAARIFGGPAAGSPETRSLAAAGTVTPPPVETLPVAVQDAAARSPAQPVASPPPAATARPVTDQRSSRPAPARLVAGTSGSRSTPDAETALDTATPFPGEQGTARTWVNIRAATGMDSPVIGIITPDTRVRFGKMRGGWVEVRTAQLTGWADRRLFLLVR